ncbi:hypothetical protein CF327_g2055 [Tilletia walkeri]|uniref:Peptidase M23 domain-containing protein n=1 Tax=Tilletia walkeri TaxID=117179 RepID=A0A8X7N569_9BASI|nr:hypothetical protein CF327_g2055 [Tilletia walkeri]KAE8265941.1 hypothetical protein A4X09_0g6408 [Tilletia walkeri]
MAARTTTACRSTRAATVLAAALAVASLALSTGTQASPLSSPSDNSDSIYQLQQPMLSSYTQQAHSAAAESPPLMRSSVSGLYVNAAHRPPPDKVSPGRNASSHALAPITLYFDTDVLDPRTTYLSVSAPKRRTWEDVTLRCGMSFGEYPVGGIESCEKDDLAAAQTEHAQSQRSAETRCQPQIISVERGEVTFDPALCPSVASVLADSAEKSQHQDELLSFTFTATADAVGATDEPVSQTWWAGHLRYGRARWPMAQNGADRWDGVEPNKVSGLFHDPFLPRAGHFNETDDMQGVFIKDAYWALGISLPVPEVGLGDEMEPVHASAGGEVVWVGKFRRPKPPAPENDEKGWTVMVRDEWGFVWQFFRLAKHSITVTPGDLVPQGHVLGAIRRSQLSAHPPVRRPPADPPKRKPDKGTPKYPYRFRSLQVNVARPNVEWDAWKPPYVDGWNYYNPIHFLSEGTYFSGVPPYSDPAALFFARPSLSATTPPLALLSTNDVVKPILTGDIEILVVFDAFLESPGDPADGMDAISLYALEWAVWPAGEEDGPDGYGKNDCVKESERVRYSISFEHSKFPNSWNSSENAYDKLFAHYVPTFSYGPFSWARQSFSSQFDEKARTLIYSPTRVIRGEPDVKGSWNTKSHPNGVYWVSVRGRDYWGQIGCVTAQVRIFNL